MRSCGRCVLDVLDFHWGKGGEWGAGVGWGAWLLPAPRTSQWSWTFPRCGPCVMDSGNRNAALRRGNNLVSGVDQVWRWGRICDFVAWEIRKLSCSQLLSKWPGIWGSRISTPWITSYLVRKDKEKLEMPTKESSFLYDTHNTAHTHAHSLLETILALTLSHSSDPASQAYGPSKVKDSQECLRMLSHPEKDIGNHKGGVPLNVRSLVKKASHHPWSLLNL